LLPETSANSILVQSLAKRWWDTTHTFHIADREMIVSPHDFHRMFGLRCDGTIINLRGASSVDIGIELLRRRYSMDTIRYYDTKMEYRPLSSLTPDDCAQMARAFLLDILREYLFANGG